MARYDSIEKVFLVIRILLRKSLPVRRIAEESGLSTMTVYRILAGLKRAGFNVRRHQRQNGTYTYTAGHYDLMRLLAGDLSGLKQDRIDADGFSRR